MGSPQEPSDVAMLVTPYGKPGRFLVVTSLKDTALCRDVIDLNSDAGRNRVVKKTLDALPHLNGSTEQFRKCLSDRLLAFAQCPPGSTEPSAPGDGPVPAGEEPWPESVDGASLLDELCQFLRSYMLLPKWSAEVLALWLVHTHLVDASSYTPYIWISSPVRECGKSTLLELLSQLAHRAQMTGGITAAALYRRIHRAAPTMLLDELDTRLRGDGGEALRGVLNTGFHRSGKVTICVGDQHEDQDFNTYCPKVLAGIGRVWDTVVSRSIPIRLRRAGKPELAQLKKIRGDRIGEECRPYRRKLLRFAESIRDKLAVTEVTPPNSLSARQGDVWRPLLAIAQVTGGHWPATAMSAATEIHKKAGDEGDLGLLLLEDLRDLFKFEGRSVLFSAFIVEELVKREDRPWAEYRGDKPMTKNGLASLLKRFEVRPTTVRCGGDVAKGYRLVDLNPLFELYLPTEAGSERTVTPVTPESKPLPESTE